MGLELTHVERQIIFLTNCYNYHQFLFVVFYLLNNHELLNAGRSNPYALSFAVSNSWSRQSNALERSVSKAPNVLPLSTELFHFSKRFTRQCCVLYPFLNPHCFYDRKLSKKLDICSNKILSNIFDNVGKMLTGL